MLVCEQVCAHTGICVCDYMTVGQSAVARDCGVAERQWVMEAMVTYEAQDKL